MRNPRLAGLTLVELLVLAVVAVVVLAVAIGLAAAFLGSLY